jgi:hypothetical protein
MPNPNDPNYTANDYFAEVGASPAHRGQLLRPRRARRGRSRGACVLPPARRGAPGPLYEIKDDAATARSSRTLDSRRDAARDVDAMGGSARHQPPRGAAPGIGGAVAAEDFAARFFGQGAALSFGVEVPYAMDPVKLDNLASRSRRSTPALRNSHAIGVLSDGGKFVPGLAPTPEQAQMLETRKFSVEDICRPYGVPPAMAGSTEPGAASFASTDTYDRGSSRRRPAARDAHRGRHGGSSACPTHHRPRTPEAQFKFNLDAVARADLLTRSRPTRSVLGGFLTPNEVRASRTSPPARWRPPLHAAADGPARGPRQDEGHRAARHPAEAAS